MIEAWSSLQSRNFDICKQIQEWTKCAHVSPVRSMYHISRGSQYTGVLEQASSGHDISFFNRDIECYKTDTNKQEESYSFTIDK